MTSLFEYAEMSTPTLLEHRDVLRELLAGISARIANGEISGLSSKHYERRLRERLKEVAFQIRLRFAKRRKKSSKPSQPPALAVVEKQRISITEARQRPTGQPTHFRPGNAGEFAER